MNKILITKRMWEDEPNHLYNELTSEIDKHRKDSYAKRDGYEFCRRTYIMKPEFHCNYVNENGSLKEVVDKSQRYCAIRLPGATRGCLILEPEENIIKEMIIYDDSIYGVCACYKPTVKSLENKFVGYKIDFTDNVMTDEERNIDE